MVAHMIFFELIKEHGSVDIYFLLDKVTDRDTNRIRAKVSHIILLRINMSWYDCLECVFYLHNSS